MHTFRCVDVRVPICNPSTVTFMSEILTTRYLKEVAEEIVLNVEGQRGCQSACSQRTGSYL